MTDKLMTAGQVAAMFRFDAPWFYRNRGKLEARGFPLPLINNLYDPLAIRAWRIAQMRPDLRAMLVAVGEQQTEAVPPPLDHHAELAERARRL